jgi:acyl-CoA-binding protein
LNPIASGYDPEEPIGASMTSNSNDLESEFQAALVRAKTGASKPDNDVLLRLYSLFKQVKEGDANGERPGGFDFVGRAKFDAWAGLQGMSREDAMRGYIAEVEKLA